MITIQLKDLQFFAYHGVHEEERILGNTFFVNVSLSYVPGDSPVIDLAQTINYALVFEIVKQKMEQPTPLLETLVMRIGQALYGQFDQIVKLEVSIQKQRPPVQGWIGDALVTYQWPPR